MEPISFDEVHVLDANSEYRGVPAKTLMENAGRGLAEHLLDEGAAGKKVLLLCGSGNNGGDGFVAARYLTGEAHVDIVLLRPRERVRSDMARENLARAEESDVAIHQAEEGYGDLLEAADFVADAMLGVGVAGEPHGAYADAVRAINASGKRVVSVDVPTGWGSDLVVQPEATVTFHAPKIGMGEECGHIVVKPIGVPEEAVRYAGPGELLLVPEVPREAHKGHRGTVLVVGGGPFTGAPSLAALAAHRAGVDLALVAVPGAVADVVRGFSMDLIVIPLGDRETTHLGPDHIQTVEELLERADAVILGPGLGREQGTLDFAVEAFRTLAAEAKPLVVDADGLHALATMSAMPQHPAAVLTPHSGELVRLAGGPMPTHLEGREVAVRDLATDLGCTVLSKGPVDIVSDGQRTKLCDVGNAAMATGGTGDVLSGVVGAFLAKGMEAFDAARAAAFAVGAAGDGALTSVGHSMVATDLLDDLPVVFGRYLPWWTQR